MNSPNRPFKPIWILAVSAFLLAGTPSHAACNIVDGKPYGDCEGVNINKGVKRKLIVRTPISENGIIEGATVLRGGELELRGMSNGDITVHEGAKLLLTGIVNGTVKNLGGHVEIEGMLDHLYTAGGHAVIGGNVGSVSGNGLTDYKKGAVIGGVPLEKAIRSGSIPR